METFSYLKVSLVFLAYFILKIKLINLLKSFYLFKFNFFKIIIGLN